MDIPASPSAPHNKARSPKLRFAAVERYLAQLVAYLERGDFTYSSEKRLDRLANLRITSYKSFVRKFLEAIVQGLVAGHGQDNISQKKE